MNKELIEFYGDQIKDLNAFKLQLIILLNSYIDIIKLIEFKGNLNNKTNEIPMIASLISAIKKLKAFDSDKSMEKFNELMSMVLDKFGNNDKPKCH